MLITRAVEDEVLDESKGFRVFVGQQIFWLCEAGQVTQPEEADTTKDNTEDDTEKMLNSKTGIHLRS